MPRIKRGVMAKKRHKKIIKLAEGYYGTRKNVSRVQTKLLHVLETLHTVTAATRSVTSAACGSPVSLQRAATLEPPTLLSSHR